MIHKKKYHWVRDLPDQRDHIYFSALGAPTPDHADLRSFCSPVEDQGALGSCTGNAIVGAMEVLENKSSQSPFVDLSRLFVYYNERAMEGTISQDAGAMIRDGIKSIAISGCCSEKIWPYNIKKFTSKPSKKAYTDALPRKIANYSRITNDDDRKKCLATGFPFVFGFPVYESFESDAVAKTGIVPMPARSEKMLGGHAVLAVGYDNSKGWWIVRNSWGGSWGDGGYFYLPFGYQMSDVWTVRK
jgi:C1A family cysteine protease